MWKYYSLAIALMTQLSFVTAQHTEPCASHHYLQQLDRQYPGFAEANDAIFRNITPQNVARDLTLLTIPVVVHIVYQNEDQNLTDSIVENVIESLNKDYRRLNEDADEVRDEFLDVAADPFIEFQLEAIERVETTTIFELDIFGGGGLPDNVKKTDEGGSDAWDTEHHLNIWVCNVEGGALLGYAYPPADLDHWPAGANAPEAALDGVVIHFEAFRTTGTLTTSGLLGSEEITIPIRGRTVTHEVGHYLGLRHIWGDGTLAIFGIPDCDADDGIEDTPNQGLSSQFQCDPTLNTCDEGADDLPDMYENFMDYSMETCQNTFTEEQVEIMRSVLENQRPDLIDAMVNAGAVSDLDQAIVEVFPNPSNGIFYLKIANGQLANILELQLIDQYGRQVKNWTKLESNTFQLDASALPQGIYFLKTITASGQQVLRLSRS